MGRIKSVAVKTLGNELIMAHPKKFSENFEKNKQALGEVKEIKSKKVRNLIAGHITNKMQKIKKSGI
ncbi:MAG: 30S ribosomal protein S17e [Nanoarchaeota archaeon]